MNEMRPTIAVSLLTLPETFPGAIYSLHELLWAVGRSWNPITGEAEAAACLFAPRLVSRHGVAIPSPAGPAIAVDGRLDEGPASDIVMFRLRKQERVLTSSRAEIRAFQQPRRIAA